MRGLPIPVVSRRWPLSVWRDKRVYRNQGWISPVVLLNGTVIGTWSLQNAKRSRVQVQPFEKLSRTLQTRIADEVATLGAFLGTECEADFQT